LNFETPDDLASSNYSLDYLSQIHSVFYFRLPGPPLRQRTNRQNLNPAERMSWSLFHDITTPKGEWQRVTWFSSEIGMKNYRCKKSIVGKSIFGVDTPPDSNLT
jgi:hypothetical protein